MAINFETFLNINFDNYTPPDYLSLVEKERFNSSVTRMLEMQKLLKRSVDIVTISEVPLILVEGLNGLTDQFIQLKATLDDSRIPKENYSPNNVFNQITGVHNNFFEASSSNKTLSIINAISNYESFLGENLVRKLNDLNRELDDKNSRVDQILLKLEKPSAEQVLSDYAGIYAKQETANNDRSNQWLIVGIISVVLFIALVVLSILCEWFPSKLTLLNELNGQKRSYEIINVPVLVTKVMLITLIIYFIVFAFRQYSIYKHLAVVYQQKKDAFNSYTLFAAAVGEKDIEAKKALLLSLVRTIHESINTGFLSFKMPEQPFINNLDVGKVTTGP